MFGRFVYGECSLSEAFWKFSVLGLSISAFITRVLMILLKQTVNYDTNFFRVFINNISLFNMDVKALALLAFYVASFIGLLIYSCVCMIGMWKTYKEYEKSKILALISVGCVAVLVFFAIKFSIY